MSFGINGRLLTSLGIAAFLWLAVPAVTWAQAFGVPYAGGCGPSCGHERCPPYYHVFVQGPPRLCWKHACPKPICNPCDLPHFGYYEVCWHPYPFPPDWSHCNGLPPAAFIPLIPAVPGQHPLMPPVTPQRGPITPPIPGAQRPLPMNPGGTYIQPGTDDNPIELNMPRIQNNEKR